MRQSIQSLQVIGPCTQSWDKMDGTSKRRHCQTCNKDVLNFAAMSPKEVEKAIFDSEGHLCARVVRRADDSIVTAEGSYRSRLIPSAATALLSTAIPLAGVAQQTSNQPNPTAIVSGTVKAPQGKSLLSPAHVVFVANKEVVLETATDLSGNWKAELTPGTYDVIFRSNPLIGERVRSVELHAGEQSFSAVEEHFAYGHLGTTEEPLETATMGVMVSKIRYPVSYFFKHPLRYLKSNFG